VCSVGVKNSRGSGGCRARRRPRRDRDGDLRELAEPLEAIEAVRVRRGKLDPILPGEVERRLGPDAALDVTVQLRLRHAAEELVVVHKHSSLELVI